MRRRRREARRALRRTVRPDLVPERVTFGEDIWTVHVRRSALLTVNTHLLRAWGGRVPRVKI